MNRQSPIPVAIIAACFLLLAGCHPQQPFYFHEDGDMSHYKGMATEIEYPDVDAASLGDVDNALQPMSLQNQKYKELWDLKLEDAIHNTLQNSKVMKSIGGQVQGPPNYIVQNPEFAATIYDPALVETNARSGVEAALSAFDTQFSTSCFWQKNDTPRNTVLFAGQPSPAFPSVLQQDTGNFQMQLQKTNATGGTTSLRHIVMYDMENTARVFTSDWNVKLEAEVRQPILRGAGVQFNRIAGPGAQPGVYNGVMIARINSDIALADFEAAVRNLVSDVETAYWELYFQYRSLDSVIAGRDSALVTWRRINALYKLGGKGGEAEKEAQAREQYFLFKSTVQQSLSSLYETEAKLRYLMGVASTDGRLIRPIDEPTIAKVSFDWHEVQCEALARSVELRQIKWLVKRRELELIASKNFLLPQLDAVAQYRWLGLGDEMIQSSGGTGDSSKGGSNAYQSMTDGKYQEWEMGFQFSLPIGFRREHSGVRNAQLGLAKERAILQEAELELSHQLAFAIRDMESNQVLCETNFNRRIAGQRQVEAVAAAYETGTINLDVLLEAQRRLAQAESDYFRSVVNYNKAIMQVHFRKGSLLEYNGIVLSEGPWPGKAYFDAKRRARARDAALFIDYGFTHPRVVSRGPVAQSVMENGYTDEGIEVDNSTMSGTPEPELVPTPAPQPMGLSPLPSDPAAAPIPQPEDGALNGKVWQRSSTKVATKKVVSPKVTAKSVDVASLRFDDTESEPAKSTGVKSAKGWTTASKSGVQQTGYQQKRAEAGNGSAREVRTSSGLNWSGLKSSQGAGVSAQPASGWKSATR